MSKNENIKIGLIAIIAPLLSYIIIFKTSIFKTSIDDEIKKLQKEKLELEIKLLKNKL